jgi:hypothetical protein
MCSLHDFSVLVGNNVLDCFQNCTEGELPHIHDEAIFVVLTQVDEIAG